MELPQRKESFTDSSRQTNELIETLTKRTSDLEEQLNRLKLKHESLQTSYLSAVTYFKEQMTNVSSSPQTVNDPLPELEICDVKSNVKSSSKKKKKRAGGKCR